MKRFVARCTPWGTIQTGEHFTQLTTPEKVAALLHETAHVMHGDHLRRLWWVVTLQVLWRPRWVRAQLHAQEFAADRYVKDLGLAPGLRMLFVRRPHPGSILHPSSKQRLEALRG